MEGEKENRMPGGRPHSHEVENENLKSASPARPSTEPKGAHGSSDSSKTRTDPATGEQKRTTPRPS